MADKPNQAKDAKAEESIDFSIGSETRSSNTVPFQATLENPITLGVLVDVKADKYTLKATGTEKDVLKFIFKDIENRRTHTHVEWAIDKTDDAFTTKLDGLKTRIKHIYEAFQTAPVEGLGTGAKSFGDLFAKVAEQFNTNGKEGTPVYSKIKIWIKVAYPKKGKAELQFPLYPNFVERAKDGVRTTLYINDKFETLIRPQSASAGLGVPDALGTANSGGFPDFPEN